MNAHLSPIMAWGCVSAFPGMVVVVVVVGVVLMIWGEVLNIADRDPGAVNLARISAI